jgi:hypothetical protein
MVSRVPDQVSNRGPVQPRDSRRSSRRATLSAPRDVLDLSAEAPTDASVLVRASEIRRGAAIRRLVRYLATTSSGS